MKKSSLNWYEKLNTALKAIEFKASNIDTYLYMGNIMIILTYVDYCIIFGPSMSKIDGTIQSLKDGNEIFVLTDEGYIKKSLVIKITHIYEKRFNISQPFLINRIISLLNIDTNTYDMDTNTKYTPVGNLSCTRTYKEIPEKKSGNTKLLSVC